MIKLPLALLASALLATAAHGAPGAVSPAAIGRAEAERCENAINAITSEYLTKYAASLAAMQAAYQKAGDLESALTVRAELNRVKTEQTLTEKSFVSEPRTLRDLQTQTQAKLREMWSQIVQSHIPKLSELKKSLTIEGSLDDAVAVRELIGQLQDKYGAQVRLDAGAVVPAETLLQDYTADKDRAEKVYKGKKITVSGSVAGFQQDAADETLYNIYLTARGATAVVQCSLSKQNLNIREEKQGLGNVILSISSKKSPPKPGSDTKIFKGMNLNIEGVCAGMDKMVILTKCSLPGR